MVGARRTRIRPRLAVWGASVDRTFPLEFHSDRGSKTTIFFFTPPVLLGCGAMYFLFFLSLSPWTNWWCVGLTPGAQFQAGCQRAMKAQLLSVMTCASFSIITQQVPFPVMKRDSIPWRPPSCQRFCQDVSNVGIRRHIQKSSPSIVPPTPLCANI